jgi:hypothetical protein
VYYGINQGRPTFLVQGQNNLEKSLRRAIFAHAAKSYNSLFISNCWTLEKTIFEVIIQLTNGKLVVAMCLENKK